MKPYSSGEGACASSYRSWLDRESIGWIYRDISFRPWWRCLKLQPQLPANRGGDTTRNIASQSDSGGDSGAVTVVLTQKLSEKNLEDVACGSNENIFKALDNASLDINATGEHGYMLLLSAALYGNYDLVQSLLKKYGAGTRFLTNTSGETAVHLAIKGRGVGTWKVPNDENQELCVFRVVRELVKSDKALATAASIIRPFVAVEATRLKLHH